MKKTSFASVICFFGLLCLLDSLFSSCAITKRKYMNGYYVQGIGQHSNRTGEALKPAPAAFAIESEQLLATANKEPVLKKVVDANQSPPPDTIFTYDRATIVCTITGIESRKSVTYVQDGVPHNLARNLIKRASAPLYTQKAVEKMAKRASGFGWAALICLFPGIIAVLIPLLPMIPFVLLANKNSERALTEIKKAPDKYSDVAKERAWLGHIAARLIRVFFSWALALAMLFVASLFVIVIIQGS